MEISETARGRPLVTAVFADAGGFRRAIVQGAAVLDKNPLGVIGAVH